MMMNKQQIIMVDLFFFQIFLHLTACSSEFIEKVGKHTFGFLEGVIIYNEDGP